jgi:hypothetical protein
MLELFTLSADGVQSSLPKRLLLFLKKQIAKALKNKLQKLISLRGETFLKKSFPPHPSSKNFKYFQSVIYKRRLISIKEVIYRKKLKNF